MLRINQLVEDKQKISLNLVVVFHCDFNVYYSSEETKIRSNQLFWKKWYALTIWVPKWYKIVNKKVGTPWFNQHAIIWSRLYNCILVTSQDSL